MNCKITKNISTQSNTQKNDIINCTKTKEHYNIDKLIKQKKYFKKMFYENEKYSCLLSEFLSVSKIKVDDFTIPDEFDFSSIVRFNYNKKQLVQICKYYNIKSSGNKPELKNRIWIHWKLKQTSMKIQNVCRRFLSRIYTEKHIPSIKIQKHIKGFMIRTSCKKIKHLMFPTKRHICKNTCDVATMDEINEIPYKDLFFYKEPETQNYYAFELNTIQHMITDSRRNRTKLLNPWNRFEINIHYAVNEIEKQQKIKKQLGIIENHKLPYELRRIIYNEPRRPPRNHTRIRTRTNRQNRLQNNNGSLREIFIQNINPNLFDVETREQLQNIQHQPQLYDIAITTLRESFIEIDLLGNYSDVNWLLDLSRTQINMFCVELYDLWFNRLPITRNTRIQHMPSVSGNPFAIMNVQSYRGLITVFGRFNDTEALFVLSQLIKCFVFDGDDRDNRTQRTLYLLGCLTIVSRPARHALRWLYETFM